MKKYKLAKDLPFAKAGTRVSSANGQDILIGRDFYVYVENNATTVRNSVCLGVLGTLISGGWIEEVKPREWHVVVNKFNDVIGYGNVDKRVTEQYRLQNHGDRLDDFEIIHVQEID